MYRRSSQVDQAPMYLFVVVELKRNPVEFWWALHRFEEIAACRNALYEAGLDNQLPCGAYVYVRPEYYRRVLQHLDDRGIMFLTGDHVQLNALTPRHIIIADTFRAAVDGAISSIPRKGLLQVRVHKETAPMGICLCLRDAVRRFPIEIDTSLNVAVRRSIYSRVSHRMHI